MARRMWKTNKILIYLATVIYLVSIVSYVRPTLAQYENKTSPQGEAQVFQTVTDPTQTFLISLAIGISGAFVYLFILLMTDRTLSILRNEMLPLWAMVTLFTISGGIVAAITQTATGSGIAVNNVQNVFMVGFGWQGVISGAGGSAKVGELKEDTVEYKKLMEDLTPT